MKRFLLFAIAIVCVSIGMRAEKIPGNGNGTYVVADGVVTFSNTTAGEIAQHFNNLNFSGATRIKFDNTCSINKADILKFVGQNATYYLDFFDITNGTNTPMKIDDYTTEDDDDHTNNIDKIIEAAVADMVENKWQAKGIILPLNTGSGTAKVEMATKNNEDKPTFTEYAAYYRANTNPPTVAIYSHDEDMKNNWRNKNDHNTAQGHYETAYSHLTAHTEVASATTYIVSTNSRIKNSDEPLDLSNITKSGATKISIVNDELVYTVSDGRSPLAFISVEGSTAGAFAAAVQNTNINGTPCEELTVRGPVNSADIAAVNEFNAAADKVGPKVYNLANATDVAKTDLKSITNPHIELIILPSTMAEQELGKDDFSTALTNTEQTNFKSAIATSSDKTKLSAYVNVPGSLARARCFATGNNSGNAGEYYPKSTGLTSVILGGNLNANDIGTKTNGNALQYESNITSIDLAKAYFANVNDMKLGKEDGSAYLENLTEVKLPTDPRMTKIPANCLYDLKKLQNLHIPYNYEEIGWQAFWSTGINHITTEDANHALIDNGPKTYTLSANIKVLGEAGHEEGTAVFPEQYVTDVYCLAMQTPVCYKATFHANMVYAHGGLYSGPYCREKYISSTNAVTLLHYPSEESFNAATGTKENSYSDLENKYTDPTRAYSKKDQTGAMNADGEPLTWPSQEEMLLSRNQAKDGYTWAEPSTVHDFFKPNYVGWHEFVLSVSSYVEPAEVVVNKKVIRNYEDAGWFTLCIPFNMTYDQVVQILGVPKSEGNVECYLNGSTEKNERDILPDIRTLRYVTRKPGKTNEVTFLLTQDLTNNGSYSYWNINDSDPSQSGMASCGQNAAGEKYLIRGGYPYVIKAYKRTGENIKNLGKYIMKRYGDQFKAEASCLKLDKCWENLNGNSETAKFVKPFEHHKVQAYLDVEGDGRGYTKHANGKNYYYTFIGQFWDQPLPQYSFYMVNKDTDKEKMYWYRYSSGTKNYTWEQYKCIIMATQEEDDTAQHPNSGKYRDNDNSIYPAVTGYDKNNAEIFTQTLKIQFLKGLDDSVFEGENLAKYSFVFDDDIVEIDEEGNDATSIKQLDGEVIPTAMDHVKVYNMAGQYVGNSTNGLSKGMYIVNGKKVVVQ